MGNFNFCDLTESVKNRMLSEVELDIADEKIFISERLNEIGKTQYVDFLKVSIENGSEEVLEALINENNCLNETETYGEGKVRKMAKNAATLLSQSEFNRFYIRALCLEAIENNIEEVEVYRARESRNLRSESESLIGSRILATELLKDLRTSIGQSPNLLPEINSGLSVKIPD